MAADTILWRYIFKCISLYFWTVLLQCTAGCREQCSGRINLQSIRHLAVDHTAEVCALAVLPAASGKFVLICGNLSNLAWHGFVILACGKILTSNIFVSGGGDFLANSRWKRHFWLCLYQCLDNEKALVPFFFFFLGSNSLITALTVLSKYFSVTHLKPVLL